MRQNIFHSALFLTASILAFTLASSEAMAQRNIAQQYLSFQVHEVNKIDVSAKSVRLLVDASTIDLESLPNAVNSDGKLLWTTNGADKKITVVSSRVAGRYELKITPSLADAGSEAMAKEIVFKDDQPRDLIVGLYRAAGQCSIVLSATAPVEVGEGSDLHLITYTLTGI